jgi:hypothetical protein
MARIGRGTNAMDLEPSLLADRDLDAGGNVAAKAHDLGEPVISPGRRLAVLSLVRCRLEHGEMSGLQHLSAKFKWVLPGGMGQLVNKAFDVDRIVVDVDPTPEPRGDWRVAHRVVNKQVRNLITECAFLPTGVEPLKGDQVHPISQILRQQRGEDRLPGDAHCQRTILPSASRPAVILHWVIG